MATSLGRTIAIGFLAGVLSVLVFHQGTIWGMTQLGWINATTWNMTGRVPPYGVPTLINQCFWGGLWGILLAFILRGVRGPVLLVGFLFGVLGPAMVNFVVLPMIRGGAMFANGNLTAIARTAFIGGTFGWGAALILNTFFRRA